MVSSPSSARGAARVALVVSLGGIAFGALVAPSRPSSPPAAVALFPPGDTTTVYGPTQLSTPNGNPTNHVNRFAVAVTPGKRYTLRMVNGAPNGSAKVTGGTVQLNGWETMTSADLASGATLERVVQVRTEDTLFVTVQGPAGAYVTASVLSTPDPSFLVFGPAHFVRTTGTPVTETRYFNISPTAAPPYRFCLKNGGDDGSNRVSSASIVLNGHEVFTQSQFNQHVASLMTQVSLQPANTLLVTLSGIPGGFLDLCVTATDTTPPVITINSPPQNLLTSDTVVIVSGSVTDETPTTVAINGAATAVSGGGAFNDTIPLVEGSNAIHIVATDAAGHVTDSTRTVIRDRTPPVLTVNAPVNGFITNQTSIPVSGTVVDAHAVTVNVNGTPLTVNGTSFSGSFLLAEGTNVLLFNATDAAGNPAPVVMRTGKRDTQAPTIALNSPAEGDSIAADSATLVGTVTDANPKTLTANGIAIPLGQNGSFTGKVPLVVGPNTITLVATDSANNTSAPFVRHVVRRNPLPPDPATVASVVNRAEVTTIGDATAFLYTGATPIQTGVAAGTIKPIRAAVLRGRVLDKNLQPLGGATVKILSHSELGQTLSRADGGYDLAVNGGGPLTLSFTLGGYLPAQRTVDVPWQDYTRVDDVILLQPDPVVTVVDLTSQTPPVARGSLVTDADSARQATVIFKPGNSATITVPGGTPQPITSLAVRITEFTVGNNGALAMPADLPPASQYTYAIQITADTQIAAGPGTTITLAQAVPVYVENFLDVPIGTKVPVGVYNAGTGTWTPEANGMALRVLPPDANGRARIDITGDGVEDAGAYAALGIDAFERERLAGVYPSGSDLWRAMAPRFEPLDLNFPFRFVGTPPTEGKVKAGCSSREGDPLRCRLQAQTAFQQVGIVGSPFTLNYASDRTQGNVADRKLEITLTGPTLPPELMRVELEVDVAGQRFTGSFVPPQLQPNLTHTFTWDGRDLYGRLLQGTQPATVLIGYVFPVKYAAPANAVDAFGLPCAPDGTGTVCPFVTTTAASVPARAEEVLVQRIETSIGTLDATALGLGGFTLDVQNVYDPVGEQLYNGDGTRRSTAALPPGITTVAGKPGSSIFGIVNAVPAKNVALAGLGPIAAGPDGSIYFADRFQVMIQKLSPDGLLTTVFGRPNTSQCTGDGGQALSATASFINDIEVGADGTVYFSETGNCNRVRKIEPTGIVRPVAGTGVTTAPFTNDIPATSSNMFPVAIAVGPDGSVYIADAAAGASANATRVRRVAPDGIITAFAGNGLICGPAVAIATDADFNNLCGNGKVATAARVSGFQDIKVGPDGSLYISGINRVRRVTPDGIIRTFAGSAISTYAGDGGPATLAGLVVPWALAIGADGTVYVSADVGAQTNAVRIRRIAPSGIITTVAGNGTAGFSGDGGPAAAARIGAQLRGMAVGADGNLYIADLNNNRIRKVAGFLPGFGAGETVIASEDGSELYVFSAAGRILTTLNAVSRAVQYTFGYNQARQLVSITDPIGKVTQIARDANGVVTGVTASTGRATQVVVNGAEVRVIGATGSTELTLDAGGLLQSAVFQDRDSTRYGYDSLGRVDSISESDQGVETLTSDPQSGVTQVTTPAGRITTIASVPLATGGGTSTLTFGAGITAQAVEDLAGVTQSRHADGSVVTVRPLGDPEYGLQAALEEVTRTTPSGLTSTTRHGAGVTRDPVTDEVLVRFDSSITNGKATVVRHDVVNRTSTLTSPTGRTRISKFTNVGLVTRDSIAGVKAVALGYDTAGRVTTYTQGNRSWQYAYDGSGLVNVVTDPTGRVHQVVTDSTQESVTIINPLGDSTRILYDSLGAVSAVVPASGAVHAFSYNDVGLMKSYTPPSVGDGATPVLMTYDLDRRLDKMIRGAGDTVDVDYDGLGRPSSLRTHDGEITVSYHPTSGLPQQLSAPGGVTLAVAYDGDLMTGRTWSGPISGSVTTTYNQDFNRVTESVNGANGATWTYDNDGVVTAAGALTFTRHPATGIVTSATLGSAVSSFTQDSFAAPASITAAFSGNSLFSASYTRDALGRVATRTETIANVTTTFTFQYDSAGRLAEVLRNGVADEVYEYDANGNRTQKTGPSGVVLGTYDAQDRILSYGSTTYQHTLNGERKAKILGADTTRYTFAVGFGSLLEVTLPTGRRIEYVVDPAGRRIGRKADGIITTGWLYADGFGPVAELNGQSQVVSRFVYSGSEENVPEYFVKGGVTYRIVTDELGSVRIVINTATGAIAQRIDYDGFGRVTLNTNPGLQPFAFAGGLFDDETGLVLFGYRDYDAEVGRFLIKDPLLFEGGDPNLYRYASGDPVNVVDQNGLFIEFFFNAFMVNLIKNKQTRQQFMRAREIARKMCDLAAAFVMPFNKLTRWFTRFTSTQAHHIFGDAAMLAEYGSEYVRRLAAAVPLFGGSGIPGSPHDMASRYQRLARGRGRTNEFKIADGALRAAGCSVRARKEILEAARTINTFYP
jgi:RHS repeat-associated protein